MSTLTYANLDVTVTLSCSHTENYTIYSIFISTGHFSIVVAPAPHLNSEYTIFGEVVEGKDVMMAINALAPPSGGTLGEAVVSEAGCLRNCDPRPEVQAKCKTREKNERIVQRKAMHPCLD